MWCDRILSGSRATQGLKYDLDKHSEGISQKNTLLQQLREGLELEVHSLSFRRRTITVTMIASVMLLTQVLQQASTRKNYK